MLRAAKQRVPGAEKRRDEPPEAPLPSAESDDEGDDGAAEGDASLLPLRAALRSCHVPLPASPGTMGRGPRSGVQVIPNALRRNANPSQRGRLVALLR